jgi:hypothetical protein
MVLEYVHTSMCACASVRICTYACTCVCCFLFFKTCLRIICMHMYIEINMINVFILYIYTIYHIYKYYNYVFWEQPYEIIWVKISPASRHQLCHPVLIEVLCGTSVEQAPHGYPMVSCFSLAESPCVYWYHYWLVVCFFKYLPIYWE